MANVNKLEACFSLFFHIGSLLHLGGRWAYKGNGMTTAAEKRMTYPCLSHHFVPPPSYHLPPATGMMIGEIR